MTDVTPVKTGPSEPVLVAGVVLWLLTQVGTFLLGHTHLITSVQWDSFVSVLVPIISTAVIAGITWVTRKFVSPAWKVAQADLSKVGINVSDEEAAVLAEKLAQQIYDEFLAKKAVDAANAEAPSELASQVPMHAGAVDSPPAEFDPARVPVTPPTV